MAVGVGSAGVPEEVRQAALFPVLDLPDPPVGHPLELARRDGYSLFSFAGATFGAASVQRVSFERLDDVLADARTFMRERGKKCLHWLVPEEAEPSGLADALGALGMPPSEEPPAEPRVAAMAMVAPPAPGPAQIEARPARTFEEFHAATHLSDEAFDLSEADRVASLNAAEAMWELQCSEHPSERTFVALVDGEIVGQAAVIFGTHAGLSRRRLDQERDARARRLPGACAGTLGRRRRARNSRAHGQGRTHVTPDPRTARLPGDRLGGLATRPTRLDRSSDWTVLKSTSAECGKASSS